MRCGVVGTPQFAFMGRVHTRCSPNLIIPAAQPIQATCLRGFCRLWIGLTYLASEAGLLNPKEASTLVISIARGKRVLGLFGLAAITLLVLAGCEGFIMPSPPYGDLSCWEPVSEPEFIDGGCSQTQVMNYSWSDNGDGTWTLDYCGSCEVGSQDCPAELAGEFACDVGQWVYFCVRADMAGDPACMPDDPVPADPVASGLWLAAVCEPDDGFSEAGNMTLAGSLGNMDNDTRLFVAAAMDGPYVPVAASGPPWVLTRDAVSALAADRGVGNPHALWFRMGEHGQPANLGSMIADRDAHMDGYCGTGE
jgi:hypothetical protein